MSTNQVQFRASRRLMAELARRGSPGMVARRDLERYYALLERSHASLAGLSSEEQEIVAQAGDDLPLMLQAMLPAEALSLASRVRDMSPAALYALIDMLEQKDGK